jgi:hypothetical protein
VYESGERGERVHHRTNLGIGNSVTYCEDRTRKSEALHDHWLPAIRGGRSFRVET